MLIIDLDGTILTVNSFPRWAAWMALGRLGTGFSIRTQIALNAVSLIMRRKIGMIAHLDFKHQMQVLWQRSAAGDGEASERDFIAELCKYIRPELTPLLDAIAKRRIDAVLATAAPGEYAVGLGQTLGFEHVLATPIAGTSEMFDNCRERKRDAVLDFLAKHGWQDRPRILFTDHNDDLPLIRICSMVHWFGSEAERMEIKRAIPDLHIKPGYDAADLDKILCRLAKTDRHDVG